MSQKYQWKQVKTNNQSNIRPSPRWGHSSCVIGQQIVIFGGYANSIYMNDLWVFNTVNMQWKQIKTIGNIPARRSNCSINYDVKNNKLVVFGGGGDNKRRYNQINLLDWNTKQWTIITFSEMETAPWQRTYHSSQLLYPYLITFGGEGIADLDDLWVFNFQTLKWEQVTFPVNALRPCGRRFHTSCLIGNQFYVIAGCHSKYRPINDVFSIDLTKLIQTGSVANLQWKQLQYNDQGFLTRWGHSSIVQGTNIFIFGGRFSNDLNDMLVIDTQKNKIKTLKVPVQSLPKPRRRSCLNIIGNCLIMFGGFNSDYYNDIHYLNVTEIYSNKKNNKYNNNNNKLDNNNMLNQPQFSDIEIKSNNNKILQCHSGILMQYFISQARLNNFIQKINGKQNYQELCELIENIYRGYGTSKLINKYLLEIPQTLQQRQSQLFSRICSVKPINTKQSQQSVKNNTNVNANMNVITFSDEQYKTFLQQFQQNYYKDITIKVYSTLQYKNSNNNYYQFKSNKCVLMNNSTFFQNIISLKQFNNNINKQRQSQEQIDCVKLMLPFTDIKQIQIICHWIITGYLIIPNSLSYQQWINLYIIADYLLLPQLQNIIISQMYSLINQYSFNSILKLSIIFEIQELGIVCAKYQIQRNLGTKANRNYKYYWIAYQQNKFEIRQELMTKKYPQVIKKIDSFTSNMEDQKENKEVCN